MFSDLLSWVLSVFTTFFVNRFWNGRAMWLAAATKILARSITKNPPRSNEGGGDQ